MLTKWKIEKVGAFFPETCRKCSSEEGEECPEDTAEDQEIVRMNCR
jgi:hypothetical protein